jgi:DNA-binding MarR family transcriptional regulator
VKTQGGFLMTQIKQVGGRIFGQMLREHGVSEFNGAQGKILYVLWEYRELPITRIARLTSLAKTTLTSMLDRLEEAGLICRRHNPGNRREVLVSITPGAQRLQKDYEAVSEQVNGVYYKGFTEQEIMLHEQKLARILANLEEYEAQNRRI